jgi:hypothetical protein
VFITQIKNITIEHENEIKKYVSENDLIKNNLREMDISLKLTKKRLE